MERYFGKSQMTYENNHQIYYLHGQKMILHKSYEATSDTDFIHVLDNFMGLAQNVKGATGLQITIASAP